MAEDKALTRRDFLKLSGAAAAHAALAYTGVAAVAESFQAQPEHIGLVEGMNQPSRLIDQLADKITQNGAGGGEFFTDFLEAFDPRASRNPELAQRNREVLDYAFGTRGLGAAIVEVTDAEQAVMYPDLSTEERLGKIHSGDNQALGSVVFTLKHIERMSKYDLSVRDGEGVADGLMSIVDWVRPMADMQDRAGEDVVYNARARNQAEHTGFVENSLEAWEGESADSKKIIATMIRVQDQYFPRAPVGIGAVSPADFAYHTGSGLEEVHIIRNQGVNGMIRDLLHEEAHQMQREALDFDLLPYLHPEDVVEDYRVRNQLLAGFRERIANLTATEIEAFSLDPGLRVKFSRLQKVRSESDKQNLVRESTSLTNVLRYISDQGDSFVKDHGMEHFFGTGPDNSGIYQLDTFTRFVSDFETSSAGRDPSNSGEAAIRYIALGNLAAYSMLEHMRQEGKLGLHPELASSYFGLQGILEGQVSHVTMGPPGEYLRVESADPEMTVPVGVAMAELKRLARDARGDSSFFTTRSVELVDYLYDQTVVRMDALARLWGGMGIEDYSSFAQAVVDDL